MVFDKLFGNKESKAKKAVEDQAKEAAKLAKKEAEDSKDQAKADRKAISKEIDHKVDELVKLQKSKDKELFSKAKLYKLVNTSIKIVEKGKTEGKKVGIKMVGQVLSNLGNIASAGKLGLEIKKVIEEELDIKLKDLIKNPEDVNLVIQSDFMKSILQDFGFWEVIRLQAPRIKRIIPKYREEIQEGLYTLIFEPSILDNPSKIFLVENILKQENALSAALEVVNLNLEEIEKVLTTDSKMKSEFEKLGLDVSAIANFVQHAPELLDATEGVKKDLLDILTAIKPFVLENKPFDPTVLLKSTPEISSLLNAYLPVISKIAAEREEDLKKLINAKPIKDQLQKFRITDEAAEVYLSVGIKAAKPLLENQSLFGEIDKFIRAHSKSIRKVLKANENAKKGVFDPDTDLSADTIQKIAYDFLGLVVELKPADIIKTFDEDTISKLVDTIPKELLEKNKVSRKLLNEGGSVAIKTAGILLSNKALKSYRKDISDSLIVLLDEKSKEKSKAVFRIIDSFLAEINSKEMLELFRAQNGIKAFLTNNKDELSTIINSFIKSNPDIAKLGITGEQILKLTQNEKTLTDLGDIYNKIKTNHTFGAVGKSIGMLITNKDFRILVIGVIINSIISFLSDNVYPKFFKGMLVGSIVGSSLKDLMLEAVKSDDQIDVGQRLSDIASEKGLYGIKGYVLKFKALNGLNLGSIEFENGLFKNFDFSSATLGKNETVLKHCTFENCNFEKVNLLGKKIDLSNSTFDLTSFISILPVLEKAKKAGVDINFNGIKIDIPKISIAVSEDIQLIKKSELGRKVLDQSFLSKETDNLTRGV